MADRLSITESVIEVARLAYSSSKALFEQISAIQNAPPVYQDLNQYIAALNQILHAIITKLDGRSTVLSQSQLACLHEVKPTLEGCDLACKNFKITMEGVTALSQDGKISFRDSFKLKFQEKGIADFRMRLADWKESLGLALDVALL